MNRQTLLRLAPALLAVILVATGAWLLRDTSTRQAAERAGTDAVATARESIVAMGTYRPDTADKDLPAARDRLTGAFLDAYTQAIQTVVIPSAKQERISSVVTVPAASVVSARTDRVIVLAFVDQVLTVGNAAPTSTPARYRVTMESVDGNWLIAGFDQI